MTTTIITTEGRRYKAPVFATFKYFDQTWHVTPSTRWYHQARLIDIAEAQCSYFEVTHSETGTRLPLKEAAATKQEAIGKARQLLRSRGRVAVARAVATVFPSTS